MDLSNYHSISNLRFFLKFFMWTVQCSCSVASLFRITMFCCLWNVKVYSVLWAVFIWCFVGKRLQETICLSITLTLMAFNFYHLVVNFKPENFHIVIFSACKSIQIIVIVHITTTTQVCSGSVVVTAFDFDSGCPGSNPECGLIYYKAPDHCTGLIQAFIHPG